jgi:hypothetical protein
MSFNYSPKIITDGLVLYLDAANRNSYPGTGSVWTDLSRSGINGTLTNMGSTGYSSSNNGVIVFDGTNDYVIHNSLDLGTVCSWGLWVKYNTLSGSQVLLGSNIANYYSLFFLSTVFYVYYGGTGSAQLSYPTGLSANTWYNIFLTRNGLTITIYLNGVSIGTMTGGSSSLSTIFSVIGAERPGAYVFNGNISNVSVYNRALSTSEVLQNYNALKGRYI